MGNLNQVAFSPDGKQLATASGFGVHVWDLPSGKCVRTLRNPDDLDERNSQSTIGESVLRSEEVVYRPDGRHLACKFYNQIFIWETM